MRYAIIEDGLVVNVIWLRADNARDFPGAVPLEDGMCISVGDTYTDGRFTHNGEAVLTKLERAEATIAELDAAILDMAYASAIGGFEG